MLSWYCSGFLYRGNPFRPNWMQDMKRPHPASGRKKHGTRPCNRRDLSKTVQMDVKPSLTGLAERSQGYPKGRSQKQQTAGTSEKSIGQTLNLMTIPLSRTDHHRGRHAKESTPDIHLADLPPPYAAANHSAPTMPLNHQLITILGPTASGKTHVAVQLADRLQAEIISADSRQVYRRMNLGTGKDLDEYCVNGHPVPYHLIDIAEPGTKYNLFEYQKDFLEAYNDITARHKRVILCGGTGLYLESVLRGYRLSPVPQNPELRERLKDKSLTELTDMLSRYKKLHNTTDVDSVQRAIRAIEIADYYEHTPVDDRPFPTLSSYNIGIKVDRETRRQRITARLQQRLANGMVDEVKHLLDEGIAPDDLIYYGLEYKYLTLYATGRISYDEMFTQLEIAIHQFAKRQMTWFRGMEKRGIPIHWMEPDEALALIP